MGGEEGFIFFGIIFMKTSKNKQEIQKIPMEKIKKIKNDELKPSQQNPRNPLPDDVEINPKNKNEN